MVDGVTRRVTIGQMPQAYEPDIARPRIKSARMSPLHTPQTDDDNDY